MNFFSAFTICLWGPTNDNWKLWSDGVSLIFGPSNGSNHTSKKIWPLGEARFPITSSWVRHTKRIRINKKIRSWYKDLWLRRIPFSFGACGRVLSKPGIIYVAQRGNTIDRLLIMGHIHPTTHGLGPGRLCPRPSRSWPNKPSPAMFSTQQDPTKQ